MLKSIKTHYVLFLLYILFSKSVLPMSHLISFRRHGSATKQWCDYFDLLDTIWNIPDISVYGLKHAKSWLEIYWVSVRVTMLFTLLLGECTFKCSRFVSDVKWMVHLTDQIDFIFRIILINVDIFLYVNNRTFFNILIYSINIIFQTSHWYMNKLNLQRV